MNPITIQLNHTLSEIFFCDFPKKLKDLIPEKNVFIITDTNLHLLYHHLLPDFPCFIISPGEKSKSFETCLSIYRWLLENHAQRDAFILGFGGGVVSDIAGFVAATFMRGVALGIVSTSLLSQVDASVGGKNGINFNSNKNIVGTFFQPKFVICDIQLLETLPEDEYRNGMAEVVKHAILSGPPFFEFLEQNTSNINLRQPVALDYIIRQSVQYKASIVSADEKEKHLRKILNLGHTVGHSIETTYGLPHGMAVSIGLAFASKLSVKLGLLDVNQQKRIENLLIKLNLPITFDISHEKIVDKMVHDKKRFDNGIDFILIEAIGKVVIQRIPLVELQKHLEQIIGQ